MTQLTVSTKGWVVIPAELREKYRLQPGTQVRVVDYGGVLALVPALDDQVNQAKGLVKTRRSLTKVLLAERAKERRRGR